MLKVAVVGCGVWGMNYLRVFSELPNSIVIGACDQSGDRLSLVHKRFPSVHLSSELQDILYDPGIEAVVVSTPATTHYEIAKECLLRGKHVLVEKPITTKVEEGEELIGLAEEKGLVLMVGHTFLFNPGIHKIKECIAQKDFGRIYYLHATRTNLGPIRHDVNAIWDLAPHDVSIMGYLLDQKPQWVSAIGARLLGNSREDVGFVTLGYPDAVIGNIHVSWIDPNKVREVVVVGSRKRIVFDDLNNVERIRIFEKGVSLLPMDADSFGEFRLQVRDGDIISPKVETSEPLKNQCQHFLDCIEEAKRPFSNGQNGLEVVRVMVAIDQSLQKNGIPVEVR